MTVIKRKILLLLAQGALFALGITMLTSSLPKGSGLTIFTLTLMALLLLGGTQLRQAWLEAEASRTLFDALQHTGLPLLMLNARQERIFINQAFLDLDRSQLDITHLNDYHPHWRRAIQRHLNQAMETRGRSTREDVLLKPGDQHEARLLRLMAARVRDPDGQDCFLISAENLSAHNQTLSAAIEREHALRTRTQLYVQTLIDVIPQPVYVKDEEGRFVLVNQTFCARHNLSRRELLGEARQVLNADILRAEEALREDMRVMAGTPIFREEHLHSEGQDLYYIISKQSCEDPEGRRVLVGTQVDITPWRTAEQAVKDALERETQRRERTQAFVQRLLDVVPYPVCLKNEHSRYVLFNDAFVASRGMSRAELIDLDAIDVASELVRTPSGLTEDARLRAKRSLEEDQIVLAGQTLRKEEYDVADQDGVLHDQIVTKSLCEDPEGQKLIVVSMIDITEIRNTQRALQKSLERETQRRERTQAFVQRLLDVLPYPVSIKNASSQYLIVNDAFAESRNSSKEALVHKTPEQVLEMIAPSNDELRAASDEHARIGLEEDQAVLAGARIHKESNRVIGYSGKHRDLIVTKAACEDPEGEPLIVVSLFDVTELREAERQAKAMLANEKSLRERTQAFIQRLIDGIPHPFFIKDQSSRYVLINQHFAEELNLPAEAILGRTTFDLTPNPEKARWIMDEDQRVLAGEEVREERHERSITEEPKWMDRLVTKLRGVDVDGQPVIIGSHMDVTHHRNIERALQVALTRETSSMKAFLQQVIDILPQEFYIKDADGKVLMTNPVYLSRRGLTNPDEILGKTCYELGDDHLTHFPDLLADPAALEAARQDLQEHRALALTEDTEVLQGKRIFKLIERKLPGKDAPHLLVISKAACMDPQNIPVIVCSSYDLTELQANATLTGPASASAQPS